MTTDDKRCPCGSNSNFSDCCAPLLNGARTAATAEQLMRSRYSAFATSNVDYLLATHHNSRQQPDERGALQDSINNTQWLALQIIRTKHGTESDAQGEVEFSAYYRDAHDGIGQLHENSRFVREAGQWYYVDGDMLPASLPGRNAPCFCGSGRKFKRCHGA